MEDKTPLETTPPPAARTAQALRELHDRAQSALAAQRERMSRLEVQLTQQLDSIASTVADQIAAHGGPNDPSQPTPQDVEQLRQEIETAQAAWQAEREQLVAQVAELSQLLDRKQGEVDAAAAQIAAGHEDFDSRQQALDDRAAELNHHERELRQRQELLDTFTEQNAAQHSELSATESALDKQRSDVAQREAALQSSQAELDGARSDLEGRERSWHVGKAELTAQQETVRAERDALEAERASLNEQLQAQSDANQSQDSELAAQLAEAQKQWANERASWDRQRGDVEEQRRLLAKERDELATALDAVRNELTAARTLAGAAAERDELRQKFELALHDVQQLRGRVAELEQELVSRPAPDQTESVELVHLRAERDAMAEQISELEQRPPTAEDSDADQQRADLQRRFELAVEDVRDLKKKNSQLEAKLAAVSTGVAPAAAAGGSWEAMKKQMLANLEDEGDGVGEERAEERATIESTIRITDEALARKDQEIAELLSQLADSGPKVPDESEAVRQLVDTDAVIVEHRTRAAQLAEEMQGKLRAAELEISVERAKVARETVHLEDLKAQIDAQRASGEFSTAPGVPGAVHQPKRRWLSKLGLGGDEET
jgi:chromosome segregation ATPase